MTFAERRQRTTDTDGVLLLLELSAPSFAEVVRLADDTQNWPSNGEVYFGFPFQFKEPDDTNGQSPRAVLVIDNVGREMTADLEALQAAEVVTAVVRVTDKADPDDIHRTFRIPMTQVVVNQSTVTATLGVDHLMRQQAVKLRYTPFIAPGIF